MIRLLKTMLKIVMAKREKTSREMPELAQNEERDSQPAYTPQPAVVQNINIFDFSENGVNSGSENSSSHLSPESTSDETENPIESNIIQLELGEYRIFIRVGYENVEHHDNLSEGFSRIVSQDTNSAIRSNISDHPYSVNRVNTDPSTTSYSLGQEIPYFSRTLPPRVNQSTSNSFGSGFLGIDHVFIPEVPTTPFYWLNLSSFYDRIFIGYNPSELIYPHIVLQPDQPGGEWAGRRNFVHIVPCLCSLPVPLCSTSNHMWIPSGTTARPNYPTSGLPLNTTSRDYTFEFQQFMMAPQHEPSTQFLNPQSSNSPLEGGGASWQPQGNRNFYSQFGQGNSVNTVSPSFGPMYPSPQNNRPCNRNSFSRQEEINESVNQVWQSQHHLAPSLVSHESVNQVWPSQHHLAPSLVSHESVNQVWPSQHHLAPATVSHESVNQVWPSQHHLAPSLVSLGRSECPSSQHPSSSCLRTSFSLRQDSVGTQQAARTVNSAQDPRLRHLTHPWTLEPWEPALITYNPLFTPSRSRRQEREVTPRPTNPSNSPKN